MATKQPITDLLRRTIIESEIPLLKLEKETGVQRASIRRFVQRENSLRLDMADKLAAYFGLALARLSQKRKAIQ
jgi:plasmid maintenance system antidote protein VapI